MEPGQLGNSRCGLILSPRCTWPHNACAVICVTSEVHIYAVNQHVVLFSKTTRAYLQADIAAYAANNEHIWSIAMGHGPLRNLHQHGKYRLLQKIGS